MRQKTQIFIRSLLFFFSPLLSIYKIKTFKSDGNIFIILKVCKINLKSDKIVCNFQSTPTQAPFDPSKIWLSCEKKTWLLCQVYIAFKNM